MKFIKQLSSAFIFGVIFFLIGCNESDDPAVDCTTSGPQISIVSSNNSTCGNEDGKIEYQVVGGNGNLVLQINSSGEQSIASGASSVTDLPAGIYTLEVTDEQSCSTSVVATLSDENGIDLTIQITSEAGCETSNGSVIASGSNGAEPYEYSLDGGAFAPNGNLGGLVSGDHSVTVKDAQGCETTKSFTVNSGVSLSGSINTIIQAKCAITACHGGSRSPDLTTTSAIISNAGRIKERTGASQNQMPPDGQTQLSADEIALIACWVDDGAIDN